MSLCSCDYNYDPMWYWDKCGKPKPFTLPRRKRCINCKTLINKGDECQELERWRIDDDGVEIPLAPQYLCETCNDLTLAIEELNGCYTLGGITLKEQITEARDNE